MNAIRATLSEVTNAAKGATPIKTDVQLLALLRKKATASKNAANMFRDAQREDLQEKELAQVAVMEEYASGVETVGEQEITAAIAEVVDKSKVNGAAPKLGDVLKALIGPGGTFDGKPVEKAEVSRLVKSALGT